jgi:hypothetical protein
MLDLSIEPGTVLSLLVLLAAALVFLHAERTARAARKQQQSGAADAAKAAIDGCAWKVRVLGVASREYRLLLSGSEVRVRRGEVLLAMRPHPNEAGALGPAASTPQ